MKPVALFLIAALASTPVSAEDSPASSNPYALYSGEVVRIADGDNIIVSVDLRPSLVAQYSVRVRGIDAPEIRRVGCPEEKAWGEDAKAQVEKLYDIGSTVRLEDVEIDSFGRALADVSRWRSDRWLDLKDELIGRGLAVHWTPDMDDVPWCLLAETR